MPLYEYFCEDCQEEFTLLQSADANKAETKCSGCGSQKTQHKFSSFAAKIAGKPLADLQKPATIDDFPNKDAFKLPPPPPRLRSEL
jgi:putative FmdB family regulatory protein